MVTPGQPKYTSTEKKHPSVDARRQVPHPLIYIELTEFHPVDGVRHISRLIPEQEKKTPGWPNPYREPAAEGTSLHVNANKTEYICLTKKETPPL